MLCRKFQPPDLPWLSQKLKISLSCYWEPVVDAILDVPFPDGGRGGDVHTFELDQPIVQWSVRPGRREEIQLKFPFPSNAGKEER